MEFLEMEASLNAPSANPDEIVLEEEEPDVVIEQKAVPSAVFGSVQQQQKPADGAKPMGALARFRNKI
jgi:hypothetical protein